MTGNDKEIIQSINQRLDARRLIEAIAFGTRKSIVIGGALRTPCMIHGDEHVATLLVFLNKHTCKCMKPGCPANREISLVELYAIYTDKPLAAAAIEAASLAGLDLQPDAADDFTETHLTSAIRGMEEGRFDDAWVAIEKARKIEPQSIAITMAAARLAELQDRIYLAGGEYLAAARFARAQANYPEAERILRDQVLRLEPDKDYHWLELAEILAEQNKREEYNQAMLQVCTIREQENRLADNVEIYEQLVSILETRPDHRIGFARAIEAIRDIPRAMEQYLLAAASLPRKDFPKRIEALQSIYRLDPQNVEAREALAALYDQSDRKQDALDVWYVLATDAEADDDLTRAVQCCLKMTAIDPGWLQAFEILARLYEKLARHDEEFEARLNAARLLIEANNFEAAENHLYRAEQHQADNPDLLYLRGDLHVRQQRREEGVALIERAAEALIQQEESSKAEAILRRLCEIEPGEARHSLRLAEFLAGHGQSSDAVVLLHELLHDKDERAAAEQRRIAAQRILELRPDDAVALRCLAVLMEKGGETDAATNTYVQAARHFEKSDQSPAAEKCLRKALALSQSNEAAHRALVEFLSRHGRDTEAGSQLRSHAETLVSDARFDDAIAALDECLNLLPHDWKARNRLAQLYLERGEKELAAVMFEAAARALFDEGNIESALSLLKRSCEAAPDNIDARKLLVEWSEQINHSEQAGQHGVELLDVLLESEDSAPASEFLDYYDELTHESWARSLPLIERLVERKHTLLESHLNLFSDRVSAFSADEIATATELLVQNGVQHRLFAEALFQAARHLDLKDHALAISLHLASIYRVNNLSDEAETLLRDQLQAHPHREEILQALVDLYENTGDHNDAVETLLELAETRAKQSDLSGMLYHANRAAELAANDFEIMRSIADYLLGKDQHEAGLQHLHSAAQLAVASQAYEKAAEYFGELIRLAHENTVFAESHLAFLESQDDDEKTFDATLHLAALYFNQDARQKAVEQCARAASRLFDPKRIKAVSDILLAHNETPAALHHLVEGARRAVDNDLHQDAANLLEQALKLYSDDPELLAFAAKVHSLNGNKAEAAAITAKLAYLHEERHEQEKAVESWRQLLVLVPEDQEAHENLARLYAEGTAADAEQAVEFLGNLARIHDEQGQHSSAVKVRRRILHLQPNHTKTREALANSLVREHDIEAARSEFLQIAGDCAARGERAQAIDHYEKALDLRGDDVPLLRVVSDLLLEEEQHAKRNRRLMEAAAILQGRDHHEESIEVCRLILENSPGHYDANLLLASLLLILQRQDEAFHVYLSLAQLAAEENDSEQARSMLSIALELNIQTAEAFERAGDILAALGDSEAALKQYESAVNLHEQNENDEAALGVLQKTAALNPENHALLLREASMMARVQRIEEANELLQRIAESEADDEIVVEAFRRITDLNGQGRRNFIEWLKQHERSPEAAEQALLLAKSLLPESPEEAERVINEAGQILGEDWRVIDLRAALAELNGNSGQAAQHHKSIAQHHYDNGDYSSAADSYARVLASITDDVESKRLYASSLKESGDDENAATQYAELAAFLSSSGELDAAIADIRQACALAPERDAYRVRLADYLLQSDQKQNAADEYLNAVRAMVDKGAIDDARDLVARSEILTHEPDIRERIAAVYFDNKIPELASQEYLELARYFLANKQLDEALRCCRKAIDLKPRGIEARELLIAIHKERGETTEACEVLKQLADFFEENMSPDKAAEALEALVAMKPKDTDGHERLIATYDKIGRFREMAEGLTTLSALYKDLGETKLAAMALERVVQLRPDDSIIRIKFLEHADSAIQGPELVPHYLKLASMLEKNNENEKARNAIDRAIAADPQNPETRAALVEYLLRHNANNDAISASQELVELCLVSERYADAAAALRRVQSIAGDSPDFHLAQAQVHKAANARGMALQEFSRAAELFGGAGNWDRKARALSLALEIDPQNIEFRRDLIKTLRSLGRSDEMIDQQMRLAETYAERHLFDLAEAEYRAITTHQPEHEPAWHCLFETHQYIKHEIELVGDYLAFAQSLAKRNEVQRSLEYISKALRLDPGNTAAHEAYIKTYLTVGSEAELCEEYLSLADLYVAQGHIDEGIHLYSKIMSLDPSNREARERLSETQSGRRPLPRASASRSAYPHETHAKRLFAAKTTPAKDADAWHEPNADKAATQEYPSGKDTAAQFLADAVDSMDIEDQRQTLEQVIGSYRDILAINPQNSGVRLKLANLLEQVNKRDESIDQMIIASETMFQKGDMSGCISLCEKILQLRPTEQKIRQRLKQSFNKRDAFKALESDILLR